MKKGIKLLTLLIVIAQTMFTGNAYATGVFGLPNSGELYYNQMSGGMECSPSWKICSLRHLDQKADMNLINQAVALDLDDDGSISVTVPFDFSTIRFQKMFVNRMFVMTSPISLDEIMSAELGKKLNFNLGSRLFIEKGNYKYDVKANKIIIRHCKVSTMENLEDVKKVMAPIFRITTVEILCCGFRGSTKKIHVVSDAGWSVFTNVGLRIEDMSGATIATYTAITGDFTTPCISLINGQPYKISFIDASGTGLAGIGNPFVRTAVDCIETKKKEVAKDRTGLNLHPTFVFLPEVKFGAIIPSLKTPVLGNIAGTGTSYSIGGELAFLPKGKPKAIRFGIDIEANYNSFDVKDAVKKANEKYPTPATDSSVKTFGTTPKKATITGIGVGPKLSFLFNRFTIGTAVLVGYQHYNLPAVNVEDAKLKMNGVEPLVYQNMDAVSKGGMFVCPKLNISYWVSKSVALSLGLNFNLGSKTATRATTLMVNDANHDNVYTKDEIALGTLQTSAVSNSMNYTTGSMGIKIIIGAQQYKDHGGKHITLLRYLDLATRVF